MSTAEEHEQFADEAAAVILRTARARQSARAAAYVPPDYANTNKLFKQQKAALTRAVNSGDWRQVLLACRNAVQQWQRSPFNGHWPDDWSRWQRALDDAMSAAPQSVWGWEFGTAPRLEDLI